MTIYFIRHLKTQGNLEKRYIGRTDESLVAGQESALAKGLPTSPDAILVSPMKRCLETKQLLYPNHPHQTVEGLRELNFGRFENKTFLQLQHDPDYRAFIEGISDPPEGESRQVFCARCVDSFVNAVATFPETATVVVVCHGGSIMAIMDALEQSNKGFYGYQVANGQGYACQYSSQTLQITEELLA